MNKNEQLAVHWTKAQPAVSAYISSLIPDFHQAEDVLHQTAVAVVRKFDQYDPSLPFLNWSIGVARYEVLKHRRQHVTDRHVFGADLLEQIADTYEEISDELDTRRQALADCLAEVKGHGREALQLRYVDGLQPTGMADQLNMTAGAVRVLLHRARMSVRTCIERKLKEANQDP